MRIAFAPAGPKVNERDPAPAMLDHAGLVRQGQVLMAGKGYRSSEFEASLNETGMILIRPATRQESPRAGQKFLKPFRQTIESTYPHRLRTTRTRTTPRPHPLGVATRVLRRLLALAAVVWHNQTTNRPGPARSVIAYDH